MADKKLKIKAELDASDVKSKIGSIKSMLKFDTILRGFSALKSVASSVFGFIKDCVAKAFDFEKGVMQFRSLIGSMSDAEQHMRMLQEMGKTPPFSLDELKSASISLMKYSNGLLGYKDSLTMIGDAAAALNMPLQSVADGVGRFYGALKEGDDIKKAANNLKNMGVISQGVYDHLIDLQATGAEGTEIWNTLTEALQKYSGTMDDIAGTGGGKIETLKGQFDALLEGIGEAFNKGAGGVDGLNAAIKNLKPTLDWLAKAAGWLFRIFGGIADMANTIAEGVGKGIKYLTAGKNGLIDTESQAEAVYNEGVKTNDVAAAAAAIKPAAKTQKLEKTAGSAIKDAFKEIEKADKDYVDQLKKNAKDQERVVDKLRDAITDASKTINDAVSNALTTTGKSGMFQSNTEASFANMMPKMDSQLQELQRQTRVLDEIRDNLAANTNEAKFS